MKQIYKLLGNGITAGV